jgi:hypothetical protein
MKDRALSIADDQQTDLEKRNHLREYLQHVILRELFELESLEEVLFHGGTALRILHGLDRFSEDLDFHTKTPRPDLQLETWLEPMAEQLEYQGYDISWSAPGEGNVQSSFVKFRGLLYEADISPHENEKLNIKLEVDCHPPAGFEAETSSVGAFFPYVVEHHDRPTFVGGKLHAILQREWAKGRDFFDLMFYLTRWPATDPNIIYLNNALEQTDWEGPRITTDNWRTVTADRVEQVDWEEVREDVEPFVLRSGDLKALRKDLLVSELVGES